MHINFIASNHPSDLLKQELAKANLTNFFQTVCGNDNHDTVYTKPTKQTRIKDHLESTNIPASSACIIADTREEIRIAREFGMISIAITGGYNSENVLRSERPDFLIHELSEITDIISSFNPKLF